MDIRFGDHPSFHKAALGMVLGSFLLGLALHPVSPFAPLAGGVLGIAAGASIAHGRATWRMIAALVAVIPLFVLTPTWGLLAATSAVLALGLAIDGPRGMRGLIGMGLSTITALVAMWCAVRIMGARETQLWPMWATTGTAAAAMGMVGVFAMLPRHLSFASDPVRAALAALPTDLDPEVKNLCDRSIAIWTTTKERLADADPGKSLVRDGVLKTLEVAGKSAAVKLTGANEAELVSRMDDFEQRIAATSDAEVKSQYQSARAALGDQLRYRERIRQGRERLVARLHNHVSTLEKFQLAATGLEAARVTTTTAGKQLDELSQDVAASGEALAELELGVTADGISEAAAPATDATKDVADVAATPA